jgi:hypothetical protein
MLSKEQAESAYTKLVTELTRPSRLGIKAMRGDKVEEVGRQLLGKRFGGVYSADHVKISERYPWCIVNTDRSDKKGEHWIALCRLANGKVLAYDSFGRDARSIVDGRLPHIKSIVNTEKDAEQVDRGKDKATCGMRSLAWLILVKAHGPEAGKHI